MRCLIEMEVEQQGGSSQHPQQTNKGKENVSQDETEGVEARTSTTDKGKEKVSQDETKGVVARTSTIDSDYDSEFDSDDDSEYDSDKSIDYLSLGEEELIKLRNRMKANKEAKSKAKGETFKEHDIYMNELLIRLKTTNEDGITQDPFISIEKHLERYPMYDETTLWRLGKPKVGEKYVTVEQFKECLTYYAMANGFSLWYEKSSGKKVVAKCGQRPPRRMTEEKTFQCISLDDEHTCVRSFNFGSLVNYKWIGKVFGDKIRANPDIRLCDIADLYEKNVGEHYALLRSYRKAILDFNFGSTIKLGVTVNPDDKTYFDRFYVCFTRLADGWKAWCRKGLIKAGKDVMPNAKRKQCARHVYENFRKHYSRLEFRNLFWAASKASYP
ncbi:multidrug resistance-associated protein 5 [Tanacetum coccineum]